MPNEYLQSILDGSFDNGVLNKPIDDPSRLHYKVPKLMVGFDTETTGLYPQRRPSDCEECGGVKKVFDGFCNQCGHTTPRVPQPVSYALTVYRDGKPTGEDHHFLVTPTVPVGRIAANVNGWTPQRLKDSYEGARISDQSGHPMDPAMDARAGLMRAISLLGHYHKQGGVIVGANVAGYDLPILHDLHQEFFGTPIRTSGFDPGKARVIDVLAQERIRTPKPILPNHKLITVCNHLGVDPGDHTALGDAKASVNAFLEQVARNNLAMGRN